MPGLFAEAQRIRAQTLLRYIFGPQLPLRKTTSVAGGKTGAHCSQVPFSWPCSAHKSTAVVHNGQSCDRRKVLSDEALCTTTRDVFSLRHVPSSGEAPVV